MQIESVSAVIAVFSLIVSFAALFVDIFRHRPRVRVSVVGCERRMRDGTSEEVAPVIRVVNTGFVKVGVEKVTLKLDGHPPVDVFAQRLDGGVPAQFLEPAQVGLFPLNRSALAVALQYRPVKVSVKLTTEAEFHTKRLRELLRA